MWESLKAETTDRHDRRSSPPSVIRFALRVYHMVKVVRLYATSPPGRASLSPSSLSASLDPTNLPPGVFDHLSGYHLRLSVNLSEPNALTKQMRKVTRRS